MKRVLAFTIAVVASMTMIAGGTQPVMTVEKVYILFYKLLYPAVFLGFKPSGQIGFIIVKAFG